MLRCTSAFVSNVCAQKQIQALNKLCSSLLEKLNNPREERDAESICTSRLALRSIFSTQTPTFVFHAAFLFQRCGRINSISTLLTPTHWSEPFPLEKAFPNVGLRVRCLRDTRVQAP